MNEARCATCRFWSVDHVETGWGWCSLAEMMDGEPVYADTRAVVASPSGEGGLVTMADFGCVQWAAKEEGGS